MEERKFKLKIFSQGKKKIELIYTLDELLTRIINGLETKLEDRDAYTPSDKYQIEEIK